MNNANPKETNLMNFNERLNNIMENISSKWNDKNRNIIFQFYELPFVILLAFIVSIAFLLGRFIKKIKG